MRRPPVTTSRGARTVLGTLAAVATLGLASLACSPDGDGASGSTTTTASTTTTSVAAGHQPTLAPAECADPGLPNGRITCHVLTLPEDRGEPDGRQVELPVLRSAPADDGPAAGSPPVVVLHGGPGAGVVQSWIGWTTVLDDLGTELVLYDQRGGGAAVPTLECPEHTEALMVTLERTAPWAEEQALVGDALAGCHARLSSSGVDLDAYDTPTSTQDLEDLRLALGVEELTLVGSSYGTRLALDYLRTHPDRVHSLVLDGVDPPGATDAARARDLPEEAVERLLSACERDERCNSQRPDLGAALERAVASFDASPREVAITTPSGEERRLRLTGDDLYAGLYVAMYDTDVIPALPSLIEAIAADDGTILDTFAARVLPALSGTAAGAFLSIDCADARIPAGAGSAADDPGRSATLQLAGSLPFCSRWPVEPVPESFVDPLRLDDPPPVLVVTGELDPITPAADGRRVAEQLGAIYLEVPLGGHSPMLADRCAQEMLRAFVADPATTPRCTEGSERPPFT